jgi:hypothetical protein
MTRSCERRGAPCRVRGAAILFLVTLLLFPAGLLALYAARVILSEQRLSANDVRAHEAQHAAQAGLEAAFAALASLDPAEPLFDGDGHIEFSGPAVTLGNGAAFSTRIDNHGLTPWDSGLLHIESTGTASDGVGMQVVRQLARRDPWLAHPPPAPLVARGAVTLAGDGAIDNADRPYAVWSGGAAVVPASVQITVTGAPACPVEGVCDADARIAALSPDGLFANFFGRPPGLMASLSRITQCDVCAGDGLDGDDRPLWIEGAAETITIVGGAAGSPETPVILVIDGDLSIAADMTVHGLIHVLGDWLPGGGALTLHGAMTVAGAVQDPGRVTLAYDSEILDQLGARGPYARIAGSWSDF